MAPNRIREIREAHSKTREELGKAIQKSALTIWRYEEGKTDIPLSSLHKMAQALEVGIEDLLAPHAPDPTPPRRPAPTRRPV